MVVSKETRQRWKSQLQAVLDEITDAEADKDKDMVDELIGVLHKHIVGTPQNQQAAE